MGSKDKAYLFASNCSFCISLLRARGGTSATVGDNSQMRILSVAGASKAAFATQSPFLRKSPSNYFRFTARQSARKEHLWKISSVGSPQGGRRFRKVHLFWSTDQGKFFFSCEASFEKPVLVAFIAASRRVGASPRCHVTIASMRYTRIPRPRKLSPAF